MGTVELSAGGFADLAVIGYLDTGVILFHQRKISPDNLSSRLEFGKINGKEIHLFRRQQFAEMFTDDLFLRVPQRIEPGLIDLQQTAVNIKGLVGQGHLEINSHSLWSRAWVPSNSAMR